MQLKLKFNLDSPLEIPMNYKYQVQSALFSKLEEIGASEFWHSSGFGEAEIFKLFVPGPLTGNFTANNEDKKLIFEDSISLEIRSPLFEFCDDLQRSFELNSDFKLFDRKLSLAEMALTNYHINTESANFRTVTPILVITKTDGRQLQFISPDDERFTQKLIDNFEKKFRALYEEEPPQIEIKVIEPGRQVVSKYKAAVLVAHHCLLNIKAPPQALEFIYNCGLGNRNSQGFGMIRRTRN